ncbi:MAG: tetratricopeptide repeat protein [Methanospirillaceae archaeon]|nr:tetratricopeptide repeat protein [Methanospirillaceae archaeon]
MNTCMRSLLCILVMGFLISPVLVAAGMNQDEDIFPEKFLNRGIEQIRIGEYQNAVTTLEEALEISPLYATAWAYKGLALQRMNRYDEAIEAYSMAIFSDPGYLFAWKSRVSAIVDKARMEITKVQKTE